MKYLRFAFVAFASSLGLAFAQDDEQRRAPPVEIPDFSNLDEYIYEPKSTLVIGMRMLSGAKVSFGAARGQLLSRNNPGATTDLIDPSTGKPYARQYHDGAVQADERRVARLDANGDPVVEPATETTVAFQVFDRYGTQDGESPDRRTNTWNYTDTSQLNRPGFVGFRDYPSIEIDDASTRNSETKSNIGLDIAMHRDLGKLFGGRVPWALTVGMSINDISGSASGGVAATINTMTDYYRYYLPAGTTELPAPPYSAPVLSSEPIYEVDPQTGQNVIDPDTGQPKPRIINGVSVVKLTETSVLLDDRPAERVEVPITNNTSVTNRWRLKGAFYTFRAGPTIWIPITTRLRATISAGAALIYAGSSYSVTETFTPDAGAEFSETETSEDYKLLPGYYADATLQFDLTERTGFYAGAVYQSAGTYDQKVENATTSYATQVDFKNLNGVRAGMTIRF